MSCRQKTFLLCTTSGLFSIGFFVLTLLSAGCSPDAVEQLETPSPSASLHLSTNSIHVGDLFTATIQVDHPRDAQITMPNLDRDQEIIVRDRTWSQSNTSTNSKRTVAVYTLTSLRVGEHVLTTNAITCTTSTNTSQILLPITNLSVLSLLTSDTNASRDIKDLVHWPHKIPLWLWGLLIALLVLIGAMILIGRFLATPRTILNQPPPVPPHEIALKALKSLREQRFIENGNVEAFYVALSGIVRTYLEGRFFLRAPEQTTEEFIREAAQSKHLSVEHQQVTYRFLEQSDLVKFAQHHPNSTDMGNAFTAAEQLIRETIPIPEDHPEQAKEDRA